ncbi:hypothetical protein Tco_0844192 [Tanacetum coccineum]
MMSLIKKTRTSCQSVGTRELSVAPANVAISAIFDLPKAGVLQSVPAVSTTKVPEMSTPPKTVEFKSVPRIMKSIDAPVKVPTPTKHIPKVLVALVLSCTSGNTPCNFNRSRTIANVVMVLDAVSAWWCLHDGHSNGLIPAKGVDESFVEVPAQEVNIGNYVVG